MPRIVRCGLVQARNVKGPEAGLPAIKKAMLDKHLKLIEQASRQEVRILCLQELFYGPYFCAEQETRWYHLTERVPEIASAIEQTGIRAAAVNLGRRDGYLSPDLHERERAISEMRQAMSNLTTAVQENITGVRTVKSFAREKHEVTKFSVRNEAYQTNQVGASGLWAKFFPAMELSANMSAVIFVVDFDTIFMFAPASNRILTTSGWRSAAAHIRAVCPRTGSTASTCAPRSRRNRTTSACPDRAAIISGVSPLSERAALTSAPAATSASTTAALPCSQAARRGVTP